MIMPLLCDHDSELNEILSTTPHHQIISNEI